MTTTKLVPLAWKDRPSLIEVAFPAQKVSIEAQTERKANAGQTLTALGSYWKGRKPLVLVRACVLGSLLPATDDPEKDLEIFELLMAMDDNAFERRVKSLSVEDVETWGGNLKDKLLDGDGDWKVKGEERRRLQGRVLARMPYAERLDKRSLRPEELPEEAYEQIWARVNAHLGTSARTHAELVEQMGVLRFGHRPRVADTFCGGGSIPFEAARVGCDVHASDLNPVACMLTWGAFNVIGADAAARTRMAAELQRTVDAVDAEVTKLGIEHDSKGNRAKAFLYCLEATCPQTGWEVPMAPSWIVSHSRKCTAELVPKPREKRFELRIASEVDAKSFDAARQGTIVGSDLVYHLNGKEYRTPIRTLRGDRRTDGETTNDLRRWTNADVAPKPSDIFRERLYCIHWSRPDGSTFFAAPTEADIANEMRVESIVRKKLTDWQEAGWVPSMVIEPGSETSRLTRERGWTHWHHLFRPRELLVWSLWRKHATEPATYLTLATLLDLSSKLCQWLTAPTGKAGGARDLPNHVFYNQSLNPFFNFAVRSFEFHRKTALTRGFREVKLSGRKVEVETGGAADVASLSDIYITDPPYADAVAYEEITEFFVSWLRKNPPKAFREWVWDTRRALAIKGSGEEFRREMVRAYSAMADHMPENGLQVVMFTHQDAGVWADMAGIFWGAGLQVTAAWYIATETTSELKKGGYVQGTVILVLRKRRGAEKIYKDELVLEIRQEVANQIETMIGLNQRARTQGRSENLFEDADLQMAGYAAALRVLTSYTQIDGRDMTREAIRPREEGDNSLVDELIEFAVAIANEHLVPEGLDAKVWERLAGSERFYLRMLDIETEGIKKLDNYQNFAKAFRVPSWQPLMATTKANDARLKSAAEFKKAEFTGSEFATSMLRALLYAVHELESEVEPDEVLSHLRDNLPDYSKRRHDIAAVAEYLAKMVERRRPEEASAARILHGLVRNEKVS